MKHKNNKNDFVHYFISFSDSDNESYFDLSDVFPWFEELKRLSDIEEKPKTRRGRKPKAHRASVSETEMKSSNE